ncbi:MAG TPA: DUF4097 family beta strand repeat-containing protein [Planctomycetota bacterium]|nr:DUF4097 family beta strand repeat-containing protein [Planctomycetota bacterium]
MTTLRDDSRHDAEGERDEAAGSVRERLRQRLDEVTGMADPRVRDCHDSAGGLSHFLRSLLAGIPWSERASREVELLFDTPAAGRIEVQNANGKTRVIGEDRRDVLLRAQKNARAESEQAAEELADAIRIRSEEVGGVLQLEADIPRKWNRHGSIDIELRVPQDTSIGVVSSNGKVCLKGLRHGVHAHSSNGSIRLDDVAGDIDITTANAKVCCSCTAGRLVARSSNGKIEVEGHRGAIDATTSNGLIHATLETLADEGVSLATSNGRIVLELPDHPDADVDIRVDNGVIRSELALGNEVREGAGRLRGRLGRGGRPIRLRTSNGTISVR